MELSRDMAAAAAAEEELFSPPLRACLMPAVLEVAKLLFGGSSLELLWWVICS